MRLLLWMIGAAMLATAGPAAASMTVFGGGLAEECSHAAIAGKSDPNSILTCTLALGSENLDKLDRAGTLINRGVMKLRRSAFEEARADLDASIALVPTIGEAWVNLGAISVGERRYQVALDNISKGLTLGVKEPEKAYFNRALAYEGLDDEKAAYLDYEQALTLKPGWSLPQKELLRFTVTRR